MGRNLGLLFIKTSQRAQRRASIKRINRRYAYIHPGKKVQRQAKIAIAIDQSGSVDDGMLSAFLIIIPMIKSNSIIMNGNYYTVSNLWILSYLYIWNRCNGLC